MNLRWRLDQAGYVSSGGTLLKQTVETFHRKNHARNKEKKDGAEPSRFRSSEFRALNIWSIPNPKAEVFFTVAYGEGGERLRATLKGTANVDGFLHGESDAANLHGVRRVHDARRRRHEMDAREGQHHTSRHAAGGGDAQSEESVREGEVHGTREVDGDGDDDQSIRVRVRVPFRGSHTREDAGEVVAGWGKKDRGWGLFVAPGAPRVKRGRDEKGKRGGKGGALVVQIWSLKLLSRCGRRDTEHSQTALVCFPPHVEHYHTGPAAPRFSGTSRVSFARVMTATNRRIKALSLEDIDSLTARHLAVEARLRGLAASKENAAESPEWGIGAQDDQRHGSEAQGGGGGAGRGQGARHRGRQEARARRRRRQRGASPRRRRRRRRPRLVGGSHQRRPRSDVGVDRHRAQDHHPRPQARLRPGLLRDQDSLHPSHRSGQAGQPHVPADQAAPRRPQHDGARRFRRRLGIRVGARRRVSHPRGRQGLLDPSQGHLRTPRGDGHGRVRRPVRRVRR